MSNLFDAAMNMVIRTTMNDGSKWDVPVMVVAKHRAKYYAKVFESDELKFLEKDTLPLFCADHAEILDWATNNMNWKDVSAVAVQVEEPDDVDYQDGWCNGEHCIVANPNKLV